MFFLLVVFNTLQQNFSLYLKIFLIQLFYLSTDVGLTEEMMLANTLSLLPYLKGDLTFCFENVNPAVAKYRGV